MNQIYKLRKKQNKPKDKPQDRMMAIVKKTGGITKGKSDFLLKTNGTKL